MSAAILPDDDGSAVLIQLSVFTRPHRDAAVAVARGHDSSDIEVA